MARYTGPKSRIARKFGEGIFGADKVLSKKNYPPVIKAVRELGSERRETVRSLSGVGVGYLRGAVLSTRGPGWTDLWCTG